MLGISNLFGLSGAREVAKAYRPRLGCERRESRDVPAVITFTLTPENIDTPDANVGDGVPHEANGRVSLRSVFQEVAASGNPVDT